MRTAASWLSRMPFWIAGLGLTLFVSPSRGEELAAGTTIEARLSVATGSRISHRGDRVEATVIAPVSVDGRAVIPQGATVLGVVARAVPLGLGLKHLTAGIEYRFHTLRLPDGETVPIEARLGEVETARERVTASGTVRGIHPTANLSSSVSLYTLPFLYVAPVVTVPVMFVKFLIAPSPDAEIYFPPGTEVILRLTAPADIRKPIHAPVGVASFSAEELADVRESLDRFPLQQAENGRKPSDRVNIIFLGSREEIDRAFHAAGWSGSERRSARSLYRSYHSLVERMGYSRAPMAKLTLNGTAPDVAYQKSLNTVSKRHHLRLWKVPSELEDLTDTWRSTATEDVAFGFRRMHMTHVIDPDIDNERDKVVNDLAFTGCVDGAALLMPDSLPAVQGPNAGGVVTDGRIAVVQLNECLTGRTIPLVNAKAGRPRSRLVRGLVALRNDVVRANPIVLGYSTAKLLAATRNLRPTGTKPGFDPNRRQLDWLAPVQSAARASVLPAADSGNAPQQ
jgi:hypothetical protein